MPFAIIGQANRVGRALFMTPVRRLAVGGQLQIDELRDRRLAGARHSLDKYDSCIPHDAPLGRF